MKILALELSSGEGSIALAGEPNECFAVEFPNNRKHSGIFFESLQRCVSERGNPDRIVVGLGPGSYAGTRIAIAAAIGLQGATSAELIGLPSLCALPTSEHEYAVIGDARRESFWIAEVRDRKCLRAPQLCSRTELAERLAQLSLPIYTSEPLLAFPNIPLLYPSARVLAEIASTSPDAMQAPLEPMYLREPHITQPKTARV